MIFSTKTMILSILLFCASIFLLGIMNLPLVNGQNGFEAMEDTFNSLRKGIRPPFKTLYYANNVNLGKNFKATLTFSSSWQAQLSTRILLRNKLMVTPKGNSLIVQGDLGYTLKYFIDDINALYMNNFGFLRKKYSMPATKSMFLLDRILKNMQSKIGPANIKNNTWLIRDVRQKLLIPSYNLRQATPITELSGLTSLSIGTLGILLFAILWDISNYFFFGTLSSKSFLSLISKTSSRRVKAKAPAKKNSANKNPPPAQKNKKMTNDAIQEVDGVIAGRKKIKNKTSAKSKVKTGKDVPAQKSATTEKTIRQLTPGQKKALLLKKKKAAKIKAIQEKGETDGSSRQASKLASQKSIKKVTTQQKEPQQTAKSDKPKKDQPGKQKTGQSSNPQIKPRDKT